MPRQFLPVEDIPVGILYSSSISHFPSALRHLFMGETPDSQAFKPWHVLPCGNPMQVILPDKSIRTIPGDPLPIDRILEELGIPRAAVIVVKNGRVVPDDVIAEGDDRILVIRVAHGG